MDKNIIAYGMSPSYSSAQNTVATLKQAGFHDSDILVLFASPIDSKRFANENHINTTEVDDIKTYSGAAIGVFLGWLTMAGFGVLTIPVIGYFIVVTPVLGGIIGASIGHSINGIIDVLSKLGMSDAEAKKYESYINDGKIFLLVSTLDEELVLKAEEILKVTEVNNISIKHQEDNSEIERLVGKKTEVDQQID